jgi:hypothetical protein
VVFVLVGHGLVHFLGTAKGFGWATVSALREPIGTAAGAWWLIAGLLVLTAAGMIALQRPTWWWAVAGGAALASQAAILTSWSDAKAGTVANVILLLAATYGFASLGPTSFHREWQNRTTAAVAAAPAVDGLVTEEDLETLPAPVARYVRRTGAVGQPRVSNFSARIHGRIRGGPQEPWMTFTGRQLNTYGPVPQRLFYIDARRSGLPVTVFHVFDQQGATMRGKALSLIPVLDAKGPEMDRSETVTLFNDLVVFAPAALVEAPVQWADLGNNRVRATYTRGQQVVAAELVFNQDGDLIDFVSDDRSRASGDGKSFTPLRWNTPITEYRDIRGRRIPVSGTAMWFAAQPEGHFSYIEFQVDDLVYNAGQHDLDSPGSTSEMVRRPSEAAPW